MSEVSDFQFYVVVGGIVTVVALLIAKLAMNNAEKAATAVVAGECAAVRGVWRRCVGLTQKVALSQTTMFATTTAFRSKRWWAVRAICPTASELTCARTRALFFGGARRAGCQHTLLPVL